MHPLYRKNYKNNREVPLKKKKNIKLSNNIVAKTIIIFKIANKFLLKEPRKFFLQ